MLRHFTQRATHWGNIRVMLGLCWGYIGIMENKMETTVSGLGIRVYVSNLFLNMSLVYPPPNWHGTPERAFLD